MAVAKVSAGSEHCPSQRPLSRILPADPSSRHRCPFWWSWCKSGWPWLARWFNHLPGPSLSPQRTPLGSSVWLLVLFSPPAPRHHTSSRLPARPVCRATWRRRSSCCRRGPAPGARTPRPGNASAPLGEEADMGALVRVSVFLLLLFSP